MFELPIRLQETSESADRCIGHGKKPVEAYAVVVIEFPFVVDFKLVLPAGKETTARIIYSLTLKLREEPFVEAIISAGAGHFRVIARHIIPNLISPIIVQATFIFAFALLQTAALDFLGVGLPPEIPSWGNMLTEARMYITRAPWLLFFPGIMIVLTVLSLNLVGDVLRDRLDPRFQDDVG